MALCVEIDKWSARFGAITRLFGTAVVPVLHPSADSVEVDVARLDEDTRARLCGLGGRVVTFVIALGDDCTLYEHELF